ncbi:MAG TPA: hypothetical protein PKY81_17425 [bacterium]|nr:hypothetical protein [bacterium]
MATGRTISASFLTQNDNKIITLCESISNTILNNIADKDDKKLFKKNYGKISYTRDAGLGVGGGKLQRDALCTRGRQGKAPFSNRNLRWHPLVAANENISYAKEIEHIEIEGADESQILNFIVKDDSNKRLKFPSDKVYELQGKYAILPKHWFPHIDRLKHWSDNLWTQNSCIIPALESCEWYDAVETYAVLGIAIATELYKVKFENLIVEIIDILKNQNIEKAIYLPSSKFPKVKFDFTNCPLCKTSIIKNPANLNDRVRESVWQPAWRSTKREEGEDSSIQIMHVNPLIERTINHNASNVRYGHRWCNVSMTDHSLDETLDFMEFIVKAHNRCL